MRKYGIEVTPASHARIFQAVIAGAVCTLVLAGLYMTGSYLVGMHRENRVLRLWNNRHAITNAKQHDHIAELDAQIEELFDENYELQAKLDRYGSINAPIIYEPGDEDAAQELHWEAE